MVPRDHCTHLWFIGECTMEPKLSFQKADGYSCMRLPGSIFLYSLRPLFNWSIFFLFRWPPSFSAHIPLIPPQGIRPSSSSAPFDSTLGRGTNANATSETSPAGAEVVLGTSSSRKYVAHLPVSFFLFFFPPDHIRSSNLSPSHLKLAPTPTRTR